MPVTTEAVSNEKDQAKKIAAASFWTRTSEFFTLPAQAKLTPLPKSLSSIGELLAVRESSEKVSRFARVLAGFRGFVTGAYTIISLALIGMSLSVIFGGVALGAMLASYVVLPILGVALLIGGLLAAHEAKKESTAQEKQAGFIAADLDITQKLEKSKEQYIEGLYQLHVQYQTCIKEIEQYAKDNNFRNSETNHLLEELEKKYEAIKERTQKDFHSLQVRLEAKAEELNPEAPATPASFLQKIQYGWKFFISKLPRWGSHIRTPMGACEGIAVMGGGILGGSVVVGTGFATAAAAGGALAGAAVVVGAAITHEQKIIGPRKKNIELLKKEAWVKEQNVDDINTLIPTASLAMSEAINSIWETAGVIVSKNASIKDQEIEIGRLNERMNRLQQVVGVVSPAYADDFAPEPTLEILPEFEPTTETVVSARKEPLNSAPLSFWERVNKFFTLPAQAKLAPLPGTLSSAAELEAVRESSEKASRFGKVLAGVRGFVTGMYTIISLALIGISLSVIFGGVAISTILAPYVVLPILGVALLTGVLLCAHEVKKEISAQEKQADFLAVDLKVTHDLESSEEQYNEGLRKLKAQYAAGIKEIDRYVKRYKLADSEKTQLLEALEKKYNSIGAKVFSDFGSVKEKLQAKAQELNPEISSTPLSFIQKIQYGWKVFISKLSKRSSDFRSLMGTGEGIAVIGGGVLGSTVVAGTGFATVAAAGGVLAGATVVVGAAVVHEQKIAGPRKSNIELSEKEVWIKTKSAQDIKAIMPPANLAMSEAVNAVLGTARVIARQNKTIKEHRDKIDSLHQEIDRLTVAGDQKPQTDFSQSPPAYSTNPTPPPAYEASPDF